MCIQSINRSIQLFIDANHHKFFVSRLRNKFLELGKNLTRMTSHLALNIQEDPFEVAVRIDDVRLTIRECSNSWNAQGGTVQLAHKTTRVGKHVEIKRFLLTEHGVLFDWIDGDSHNLGIQLSVLVNVLLESSCFERAALREGSWVKVQHGPLAALRQAFQRSQPFALAVGQFESGRLCSSAWKVSECWLVACDAPCCRSEHSGSCCGTALRDEGTAGTVFQIEAGNGDCREGAE
mmetsp:Transcript_27466/g.77015  ORF Transcript_27466/g.77015 Transcript_27466/m.77015 type:complete len:235 (+) Transcript_27466:159-863(+)